MFIVDQFLEASNGSQNGSADLETTVEQSDGAHDHVDRKYNDQSRYEMYI